MLRPSMATAARDEVAPRRSGAAWGTSAGAKSSGTTVASSSQWRSEEEEAAEDMSRFLDGLKAADA